MAKLKTIYDKLKPEFKNQLQVSARKYDSAKRLKYNLMSNTLWSDLTLSTISDISVCLLYTSPSPRDKRQSRMACSA